MPLWRQVIAPSSRGRCRADARTAACPVRPDRPDDRVRTEGLDAPVHPDHRASQANRRTRFASISHLHRAGHVHRAAPANPDPKVLPAIQDHPDRLATLAETAAQEALDLKDHPVHPEIPVQMDHAVNQVSQQSALPQHPETLDQPDPMDHPVKPGNQDKKETTVNQATPDPKDHPDRLAAQAKMGVQETKAHPVPTDQPESGVSARNIAPWTAASSSKTAQGVKRRISTTTSFLQSDRNGFGECLLLLATHTTLLLLFPSRKRQRQDCIEFRFYSSFNTALNR
jgi:hypothetical protein